MKKLFAILLISILFFNWYGYRIVIAVLANDADKQLELKLDNNDYDESQLIELKAPLNLPYPMTQSNFIRCYGEIEIEGKLYTYVKKKYEDGFVIMKCIPNSSKEQIKAAGDDFFKMTNDLGRPNQKQDQSNFAKNFWSEYDGRENDYTLHNLTRFINKDLLDNSTHLYNISLPTPDQPPEAVQS